jgi:hypothetical protein
MNRSIHAQRGSNEEIDIDLTEDERNLLMKIVTIEEEPVAKFRLAVIRNDVITVKVKRRFAERERVGLAGQKFKYSCFKEFATARSF